jgi:hypothetical protein
MNQQNLQEIMAQVKLLRVYTEAEERINFSPEQRAVARLAFRVGHSTAEITEILEIPRPQVESARVFARNRIEAYLSQYHPDLIEQCQLDWDGIVGIVQEEYKVREEAALEQYQAATPRILERLSEQLDAEEIDDRAPTKSPLKSLFEAFINSLQPQPQEFALAARGFRAEGPFDVDALREYYDENLIDLDGVQVHVTIETDNDHIVLHIVGDVDFSGAPAAVYRLDAEPRITARVEGNDIRFRLSELGLKIGELDRVGVGVELEDGRLDGRL